MAFSKSFKQKLAEIETSANQKLENINAYHDKVKQLIQESDSDLQSIKEQLDSVSEVKKKFDADVESILDVLSENPELAEDAQNLQIAIENIKDLQKQITVIYKQIYGFDKRNPDGTIINHEEGLKDKLEKSYNDTAHKLTILEKNSKDAYNKYLSEWENSFQVLKKSIESLLPAATSAGLASAYNSKKEEEEKSLNRDFRWFVAIIVSMVAIGSSLLIPQIAPAKGDYVSLISRLVLFAPLIWIGIYQNKKINISKKIIEEYAHKATLMKTFDGLFKQIFQTNKNGKYISSDNVRESFLLQTLNAVDKNPAECISDCNKSDNPMLDIIRLALKKSKNNFSENTFGTILKEIKGFLHADDATKNKNTGDSKCPC